MDCGYFLNLRLIYTSIVKLCKYVIINTNMFLHSSKNSIFGGEEKNGAKIRPNKIGVAMEARGREDKKVTTQNQIATFIDVDFPRSARSRYSPDGDLYMPSAFDMFLYTSPGARYIKNSICSRFAQM